MSWDSTDARRIALAVKFFSDAGETESQVLERVDRIAENWSLNQRRARHAARTALRLWRVQRGTPTAPDTQRSNGSGGQDSERQVQGGDTAPLRVGEKAQRVD